MALHRTDTCRHQRMHIAPDGRDTIMTCQCCQRSLRLPPHILAHEAHKQLLIWQTFGDLILKTLPGMGLGEPASRPTTRGRHAYVTPFQRPIPSHLGSRGMMFSLLLMVLPLGHLTARPTSRVHANTILWHGVRMVARYVVVFSQRYNHLTVAQWQSPIQVPAVSNNGGMMRAALP